MNRRKRILDDLDADIRDHIARETQDNIDRGMPPAEARFAALRKFGNVTRAKENTREVWIMVWLEQFLQDVRFGLRMLRKSPGFTLIAILTLALGIGANTAIFSVVDSVLLKPPPYRDPDRIVWIVEQQPRNSFVRANTSVSLVDYQRRYPEILSQVASVSPSGATMTGIAEPEVLDLSEVSSEFFPLLGWQPALGRESIADDEKPGAAPVMILSDALWKRAFSSDRAVIGRVVLLDNVARTIVGVMPRDFQNPLYSRPDAWIPLALGKNQTQWIARMSESADVRSATTRLTLADQTLDGRTADWHVSVTSLHEALSSDLRPGLLILLGCAAFVLLVACTNVANLLLARGTGRRVEITVRSAVGASQPRIARQMLTENLLLGCMGGAAGLAVAYWTLKFVIAAAPAGIQGLDKAHLDARILWFTVGVSIFTSLLFGALPTMRLTRVDLASSLKEGVGTGAATGVRHSRALSVLVACEVAMALILMLGALLMVRSFLRIRPNHPGFDPGKKLSVMLRPAEWKYPTTELRQQFFDQVIERIGSLPSVKEVAAADFLPLSGMVIFGRASTKPGEAGLVTNSRAITPNYFRLMGISLLSGREFTNLDNATARKVAIISRKMAERIWPGQDALGKHFTAENKVGQLEVVGIVADTRESRGNVERWSQFYVPMNQTQSRAATLVISTTSEPDNLVPAVRGAILAIDKDQAMMNVRTLQEIVSSSVSFVRFETLLMASFAAIALVLASVGIYGVISYSVRQRTRELGIRIALGASSPKIIRAALAATMLPVAVGLAAGWLATLWLTRFMSSELYGLSRTDAAANIAGVSALCIVAALASYIPARRASRIDPIAALRSE